MTRRRWCVRLALLVLLVVGSGAAQGQEDGAAALPPARVDLADRDALRRGAALFFDNCAGCHSLKYQRYSRLAADLGLSKAQVMDQLDATGGKFDEPALSAMPAALAQRAFGKAPPDLSLEVRVRGADWVFAYLNGFYLDRSRPLGWNNAVFADAVMPNALWQLQGLQVMTLRADHGERRLELSLRSPGALNPQQFHAATRDLTAFLAYVSEPAALQRRRYGVWVLGFLALFAGLAYLLKREYWKDVR